MTDNSVGVDLRRTNLPLRDIIENRLKAPVIIENDVNCAAIGEKWMGAGRGINDLLLITLGTGIDLASSDNTFTFSPYPIGGGALASWESFSPSMFDEVKLRSFTFRNTKTSIERAILGNEAGLYGAAFLPFESQPSRSRLTS